MERVRGFTIVELMVVMGLFGIVSSVVITIYFQLVQASNRAAIATEVEQNASYAMELMVREVRKAGCVGGEVCGGSGCETLLVKDTNCEEMVTIFKKSDGDLVKVVDSTEHPLNDSDKVVVKSIKFGPEPLDSSTRSVIIDLTMESAKPSAHTEFKGEISLHETVSLRKY